MKALLSSGLGIIPRSMFLWNDQRRNSSSQISNGLPPNQFRVCEGMLLNWKGAIDQDAIDKFTAAYSDFAGKVVEITSRYNEEVSSGQHSNSLTAALMNVINSREEDFQAALGTINSSEIPPYAIEEVVLPANARILSLDGGFNYIKRAAISRLNSSLFSSAKRHVTLLEQSRSPIDRINAHLISHHPCFEVGLETRLRKTILSNRLSGLKPPELSDHKSLSCTKEQRLAETIWLLRFMELDPLYQRHILSQEEDVNINDWVAICAKTFNDELSTKFGLLNDVTRQYEGNKGYLIVPSSGDIVSLYDTDPRFHSLHMGQSRLTYYDPTSYEIRNLSVRLSRETVTITSDLRSRNARVQFDKFLEEAVESLTIQDHFTAQKALGQLLRVLEEVKDDEHIVLEDERAEDLKSSIPRTAEVEGHDDWNNISRTNSESQKTFEAKVKAYDPDKPVQVKPYLWVWVDDGELKIQNSKSRAVDKSEHGFVISNKGAHSVHATHGDYGAAHASIKVTDEAKPYETIIVALRNGKIEVEVQPVDFRTSVFVGE